MPFSKTNDLLGLEKKNLRPAGIVRVTRKRPLVCASMARKKLIPIGNLVNSNLTKFELNATLRIIYIILTNKSVENR